MSSTSASRSLAGLLLGARVLAVFCATLVWAGAATAADGGSGTYIFSGHSYDFVLLNGGTASWQYFVLVGPPGTQFVGGGTGTEAMTRCVPGQPDGLTNEIECGPMAPTIAPPSGHLAFVATLATLPACGLPFQLEVSSTGLQPFSRVGDAIFTGSCAAARPKALTAPAVRGTPVVGRSVTATPPTWNVVPVRVTYQWQLCTKTACAPIREATKLTLRLVRRMAGHVVRFVATATFDAGRRESISRGLLVRP